MAPSILKSVQN